MGVEQITALAAGIATVIGAVAAGITKVTQAFKESKQNKQYDREFKKSVLRAEILNIYYDCRETKTIPFYQYELVKNLFETYKSLGGNSFVEEAYMEIEEFEVLTK